MSKDKIVSLENKRNVHKKPPTLTIAAPSDNDIPIDLSCYGFIHLHAFANRGNPTPFKVVNPFINMSGTEIIIEAINKAATVCISFDKKDGIYGRDTQIEEVLSFLNLYLKMSDYYTHKVPVEDVAIGNKLTGLKWAEVKLSKSEPVSNLILFKRFRSTLLSEGFRIFINFQYLVWGAYILIVDDKDEITHKIVFTTKDFGRLFEGKLSIITDTKLVDEPKKDSLPLLNSEIGMFIVESFVLADIIM